jgi:hypothetical protein
MWTFPYNTEASPLTFVVGAGADGKWMILEE